METKTPTNHQPALGADGDVRSIFQHSTHRTGILSKDESKTLDILLDKIDKPQWKIGYNFHRGLPRGVPATGRATKGGDY